MNYSVTFCLLISVLFVQSSNYIKSRVFEGSQFEYKTDFGLGEERLLKEASLDIKLTLAWMKKDPGIGCNCGPLNSFVKRKTGTNFTMYSKQLV